MYFFEENAEVCSIFLYKNRNARPNLCFPYNYIIYIKLFYMLLYIIFIVIIYLTDTYICKKTISHILLTYKNNFLTNKILDCFGTKILVIVYKSLVRFKDECNNITYYLNIFITKCSTPFYFLITLLAQPNIIIRISPAKSCISRKCKWPVFF